MKRALAVLLLAACSGNGVTVITPTNDRMHPRAGSSFTVRGDSRVFPPQTGYLVAEDDRPRRVIFYSNELGKEVCTPVTGRALPVGINFPMRWEYGTCP